MRITLTPNKAHLARMRALPALMTPRMDDRLLLRDLDTVNSDQMREVFQTEGTTARGGMWAALSPRYRARKIAAVGRRKTLDLTGETKRRFISRGNPNHVARYIPTSSDRGLFTFGAKSDIAAAHVAGNPALAPGQSLTARKVFHGRAPRLPVRSMIGKSAQHLSEFRRALVKWYVARMRQFARASGARP